MTRRPLIAGVGLSLAVTALATALPTTAHAAPVPGWRPVHQTPGTGGLPEGYDDVAALGAKNAWAVGSFNSAGTTRVARWNGTSWQQVPVPASIESGLKPYSTSLHTVTASSATDVWAFGHGRRKGLDVAFGIHWNGTKWTRKLFADRTRVNDAVSAGKQTWVAGSRCANDGCRGFVQRFDGKTWRAVPLPKASVKGWRIGFNRLSATSATNIWAAGSQYSPSAPAAKPVLARWNGTRWTVLSGPKVALRKDLDYRFTDVVALGPKNVWATGVVLAPGEGSTYAGLLMHWNGTKWRTLTIKEKQGLVRLAPDGKGGFWLLSGSYRSLLHVTKNTKVDRRYAPKAGGKGGQVYGLTRIPGTQSLWATGISGRRGTIWKYGP